jgi:hypothetical protein
MYILLASGFSSAFEYWCYAFVIKITGLEHIKHIWDQLNSSVHLDHKNQQLCQA